MMEETIFMKMMKEHFWCEFVDCTPTPKKWIEWCYVWKMKYKRYDWISKKEFYEVNKRNINKHLKSCRDDKEFNQLLTYMYDDIMSND